MPVLLMLLVVGISFEQKLDRYEVGVGEDANVMLKLDNTGEADLDVSVAPDLPEGVISSGPPVRHLTILPGKSQLVTYAVSANETGAYAIASQIDYTDAEGKSHRTRCGDKNGWPLMVS